MLLTTYVYGRVMATICPQPSCMAKYWALHATVSTLKSLLVPGIHAPAQKVLRLACEIEVRQWHVDWLEGDTLARCVGVLLFHPPIPTRLPDDKQPAQDLSHDLGVHLRLSQTCE